ncbi:GDCCVxC domain-containing (seleno)protein [Enterovibrio nigricans]|uniref:GDCCVxC domain-containing (seleno)protein n=1 Tax=Enterovibrio nigricans TaxID=504469 RepID=UPI0018E3FA1B|nr:GDCCVxC domain-containing (seleno)protein [Enterovibrio nigricans]
MNNLVLESEITCPYCGMKKVETMPTNACQWFYECEKCHALLKPKQGDCCVYCSFGSVPCPPIQEELANDRVGCCRP